MLYFSSLNSRRSNSGLSENIFHAQLNSLRTNRSRLSAPHWTCSAWLTQGKLHSRSQKTFDLKSIYCEEVKSRIKFCLNIYFSVFRHFSILKPSIIDFSFLLCLRMSAPLTTWWVASTTLSTVGVCYFFCTNSVCLIFSLLWKTLLAENGVIQSI